MASWVRLPPRAPRSDHNRPSAGHEIRTFRRSFEVRITNWREPGLQGGTNQSATDPEERGREARHVAPRGFGDWIRDPGPDRRALLADVQAPGCLQNPLAEGNHRIWRTSLSVRNARCRLYLDELFLEGTGSSSALKR